MRKVVPGTSNTLYYMASDHLGGTTLVMNGTDGTLVSRVRYYPHGTVWTQENAPPTDKLFTGYRRIGERSGLYYANSRFYSADLGRFLRPDSIVPGAANPQSLNRYSYVLNNPLTYTDPTGHCVYDMEGYGLGLDPVDERSAAGPTSTPRGISIGPRPDSVGFRSEWITITGEELCTGLARPMGGDWEIADAFNGAGLSMHYGTASRRTSADNGKCL